MIAEPQQLSAIRQRRAYLSLDDTKLSEIYERANAIRAVILVSYFERLFHRHQTKFLSKGKTINRLVCFQDENAKLDISEDSQAPSALGASLGARASIHFRGSHERQGKPVSLSSDRE